MNHVKVTYVKKSNWQLFRMWIQRLVSDVRRFPGHCGENLYFTIGLISIYTIGSSGVAILAESVSFLMHVGILVLLTICWDIFMYIILVVYESRVLRELKRMSFFGKMLEISSCLSAGFVYHLPFVFMGLCFFFVSRLFL